MSLTEIAIKRPSLIIVIFMVLILGGLWSYSTLKYELIPDFSEPTLIVTTVYPGGSPLEVEEAISTKIEEALSSLENVNLLFTQSYEGLSLVVVFFKSGTDIKYAAQVAQQKIDNKRSLFPPDAKSSVIKRISPSDAPVIQLVVGSSSLSSVDLYDLMEREMRPLIEQTTGVAEVDFIGGQKRELQINVSREKLEIMGLSIPEVIQAIRENNVDYPSGKVRNSQFQSSIRLSGKVSSLADIKSIQINRPSSGGTPILIQDVAEVVEAEKEPEAIVRINKTSGVAVIVKRQVGSNAVDISKNVRAIAKKMEQTYVDKNLSVFVADDTSLFTLSSATAVVDDLIIAIILVAFVIMLFLHSFRDSFIVMIAIPASLISTFIVMYLMGYTLNLMTLLAMSLVIGILVDDSIVVLENIHRHLAMGKTKVRAAIDGRKEIGFSALAITLVDVVVFAPIIFLENTIAELLRQYSVVVVVSTLMSLFVSFTLTPWIASRIGKITVLKPNILWHRPLLFFEMLITRLTSWYVRRLAWSLRHKLWTLLAILGTFGLTAYVMTMGILGEEMVAAGDQGKYRIALEYDKNTSLFANNLRTQDIEEDILAHPLVTSVFSNVGGPSTSGNTATLTGITDGTKAEIMVSLVDFSERSKSTQEAMREMVLYLKHKYYGVKIEAFLVAFRGMKPMEVRLQSVDREALSVAAGRLEKIISTTPGAINVERSVAAGTPELEVRIDREKMNKFGISSLTLGTVLRTAINGSTGLVYTKGDSEYDIVVRYDLADRQTESDVRRIMVKNNRGQLIPITSFCRFVQNTGYTLLERTNRTPSITLKSDVLGITSGVLATSLEKRFSNVELPTSVSWQWGGEVERQNEAFGALGVALLASLILVYLIMVMLYDSFLHPFVVLFSIPVAIIGALLALNIGASSISIFTILGMMMLLGLVAKNGILLVDYTNQMRTKGYLVRKALLESGRVRLRPILMTTISMALGMLPIAIASGASAEWKNGLGIVMVGGLISSLMLTVFLVPVIYEIMDKLRMLFSKKLPAKKEA